MAKHEINVKAIYYAWCTCLYALMRYLGIFSRDPLLLIGAVIVSWSTSFPLTVCATTLLKRQRSTFNDLPGPQVRANTASLIFSPADANRCSR